MRAFTFLAAGALAGAGAVAAPNAPGSKVEVVSAAPAYLPVFDSEDFAASVPVVNGKTQGSAVAATALAAAGPLPSLASCAASTSGLMGACGDMNVAAGAARARAYSDITGQTGVTLTMYDTLTIPGGLSSLTFKVRIEGPFPVSSGQDSRATFFYGLSAYDGTDYNLSIFAFGVEQTTVAGVPQPLTGFIGTPSGLTPITALQPVWEFDVVVPVSLTELSLAWSVSAGTGVTTTGSSSLQTTDTAYFGITGNFSSAGGFSHLGYAAVVPELPTMWLLATGVLLVASRRAVQRLPLR